MNELIIYENKTTKIKNLITYFFIYSFLGWILETIYAFLVHGHYVNRGFLISPFCPIYGFGAIMLILLLKKSKGNYMFEFFYSAIIFTIFEYMASYILEVAFGLRWWDYTNDFLNLQGRVSLAYSIIWGVMGIFLTELLHPFIEKSVRKIKRKINVNLENIILIVLTILVIVDFTFCSIKIFTI